MNPFDSNIFLNKWNVHRISPIPIMFVFLWMLNRSGVFLRPKGFPLGANMGMLLRIEPDFSTDAFDTGVRKVVGTHPHGDIG